MESDVFVKTERDPRSDDDIPLGPRSAVPAHFTAWVDDPVQPYRLTLDLSVLGNRGPEVLQLLIQWRDPGEPGGVTPVGLRAVKLARAVKQAIDDATFERPRVANREGRYTIPGDPPGAFHGGPVLSSGARPSHGTPPGRGRRTGDDFLRLVATTYRDAIAAGRRDPVGAVKEQHHGVRSTAGRWVAEARKRGFLGPAIDRKAGEAQPPGPRNTSRPRKDK